MTASRPSRRLLLSTGAAAALAAPLGLAHVTGARAASLPRATVAARRKFFGPDNVSSTGAVRRDRVILSWFGVTNFALAIDGHVVLLDAWVPRGAYSRLVPTSPEELAALKPSQIFIGHGHFDHAADAAPIAAASGAVVVGTAAQCAQISQQAPGPIRTRPLDLDAVGSRTRLTLGSRIGITVMAHVHSAVTPPTGEFPPLLLPPDFTPVVTHPPTLEDLLGLVSHQPDQEGGTLLYRFTVGTFSLLWNDSCGPIRDHPTVVNQLKALPRTTVQVGAIQGFGQLSNGLRDPLDYIRAVRPRVFVPSHHDNWTPPVSSPASGYERPLRDAVATIPAASRPAIRFITDPDDYIRPGRLTFSA